MILGCDTIADHCALSLLALDRSLIIHRVERMKTGQAERLAPMLREMLHEAQIRLSDLRGLGVTLGPGSFTGLRVGLSFMRGLRLGLGVPLVGIDNLRAALPPHVALGRDPNAPAGEVLLAAASARSDRSLFVMMPDVDRSGEARIAMQSAQQLMDLPGVTRFLAPIGLAVPPEIEPRTRYFEPRCPSLGAALAFWDADREHHPALAPIYGHPPRATLPKPAADGSGA